MALIFRASSLVLWGIQRGEHVQPLLKLMSDLWQEGSVIYCNKVRV
ncbi:hypothetical protein PSCICN_10180 [Pseudomonas cichorii]|nr:hypothetical protein PSCICN_10180 [Pseudomonas cichorii]